MPPTPDQFEHPSFPPAQGAPETDAVVAEILFPGDSGNPSGRDEPADEGTPEDETP